MGVILVVDDEPVTQLMLGLMLQRSNYKVITAVDGQEAMNHLANEKIDLAIIDVNMPKMDGMTMLQRLRADKRFEKLPVIMFTAQGQERIRQEAAQKGATGFLTKPASSTEVTNTVARFLTMAMA
jgi:CheY-like chemotaxis protein